MRNLLPRPLSAPHHIPLWAWHRLHWLQTGKHGHRPGPSHTPMWFHAWRFWRLARAKGKGSRAWKRYRFILAAEARKSAGEKVAASARLLANQYGAVMPYTMSDHRDDWLQAGKNPPDPPIDTDCSGFATLCYWENHLPDPNGLAYKWLGWTGTMISFAQKHGKTTTDVSKARPGDLIVIGPGPGDHVVVCAEAGPDPVCIGHGRTGVDTGPLSVDPRTPKTVCMVL